MPPEAVIGTDFLHRAVRELAARFEGRQVAQLQLTDTTATSAYTPGQGVRAVVRAIMLVNTGSAKATVQVFHDDDGTTYDDTTVIWKGEVDVANNPPIYTVMFEGWIGVDSPNANIAVKSDQAGGDITATLYGTEIETRQ